MNEKKELDFSVIIPEFSSFSLIASAIKKESEIRLVKISKRYFLEGIK